MASLVQVAVHSSQFPGRVRQALIESLRSRKVDHRFHYDSVKQAQKWLALHEAFSPARTDPDCAAVYDRSFDGVVERTSTACVEVIGLGCGGGQKDSQLLRQLKEAGKGAFYTAVDVSTALVLVAREAASRVIPADHCSALVCDLVATEDLPAVLDEIASPPTATSPNGKTRIVTFFGMIPNFEQEVILPRLATLIRSKDFLLLSANLAPGPDYSAGVDRILPMYDNAPTRDWLMTFLLDLGVERDDGELRFMVESDPTGSGLKRVAAYFLFARPRVVQIDDQHFAFTFGDAIRLFFSYRHTPTLVEASLRPHGLKVLDQWITRSEEEGVFLVARA